MTTRSSHCRRGDRQVNRKYQCNRGRATKSLRRGAWNHRGGAPNSFWEGQERLPRGRRMQDKSWLMCKVTSCPGLPGTVLVWTLLCPRETGMVGHPPVRVSWWSWRGLEKMGAFWGEKTECKHLRGKSGQCRVGSQGEEKVHRAPMCTGLSP